jgi:uncharacterized protein (TIGR03083 family)
LAPETRIRLSTEAGRPQLDATLTTHSSVIDFSIRHAEPGDYAFVIGVVDEWWGGRAMADMLPRLFFTHFRPTSFVAERGSAIVGFLCGFVSTSVSDIAYVHFVGVDPRDRDSGIARALYQRFFDVARTHRCKAVHCVTSPANATSIQFHRALGFEADLALDYDGRGNDRVMLTRAIDEPPLGAAPIDTVRGARAAHALLLGDVISRDFDPRAPTRLPGWSVGHLLTHLARNADSLTGMFRAAADHRVGDQYPGGRDQRAADIETGSGRDRTELLYDLERACAELEAAWAATTNDVWEHGVGRSLIGELPLATWPFRRWREVEIHHADLGFGHTFDDWTDDFVTREWPRAVSGLAERIVGGRGVTLVPARGDGDEIAGGGIEVRGSRRELLAWILSRHTIAGSPNLEPWG